MFDYVILVASSLGVVVNAAGRRFNRKKMA